ncbi:hypothetical protein AB0H43_36735 [Hamadaea sp. NPDC050747]|uniref:hypothetical protein n=1 Tax=Hamadaea sp. NPDC050747 TaxID=3155789 RepID=UPI0033E7B312
MSVVTDDPMGDMIIERLSRCTHPVKVGGRFGTAFLYNELLESTPETDRVREWVVTADQFTRDPLLELRLRPELIELAPSADYLALIHVEGAWTRRAGVGVLSSWVLHEHADRKGWRWRTQEVTDGIAATKQQVQAVLADGERRAWALGHFDYEVVEVPGEPRPQGLVGASVTRDPDGVVRWRGELPEGFAGAPVFVADQLGRREFAMRCVGVVASADRNPTIVTFDIIRELVARASNSASRTRGWRGLLGRRRGDHT